MSDRFSSYATVDGHVNWADRGRWSVVTTSAYPEVWRYRSKSAANRFARWMRSVGNSVKVRAYRRRDVRVAVGGFLEPAR